MCLSATMPLYGDDSDDEEKPAPTVRKTFKEIAAEFKNSGVRPVQQDLETPKAYATGEKIPSLGRTAEVFEEIKALFRKQIYRDFAPLKQNVWKTCPTLSWGTERTEKVLESWLPYGCVIGGMEWEAGRKSINGFDKKFRVLCFKFTYKCCSCFCKIDLYEDTKVRMEHTFLRSNVDGAYWECKEIPHDRVGISSCMYRKGRSKKPINNEGIKTLFVFDRGIVADICAFAR